MCRVHGSVSIRRKRLWTLARTWPFWDPRGSPNMKVDRTDNSSLYTRCLRARHIEIVIHSRKTPSSLRAPPDCRGGSVWVGSAFKKV